MKNPKIQKSIIRVISAMLVYTMIAAAAFAQVPKKVNYQGYLEDKNTGLPVNGMKTMEFAIYDALTGGTQFWSESWNSQTREVEFNEGKFSVRLGEFNQIDIPDDLPEAKTYYLEVKVDGEILVDSEGNEREELTSVLYARFVDGVTLKNGNTLVGIRAGKSLTTGSNNTFVGWEAGTATTTGAGNTFIGTGAGRENTEGWWNTFMGIWTGANNTTGTYNTFVGHYTGNHNTTGNSNTFIGKDAGAMNTTASENTFIGKSAGRENTEGQHNTFVGVNAGYKNVGDPDSETGFYNTFIGSHTGWSNIEGRFNTFIGYRAGYKNLGDYYFSGSGEFSFYDGSNNIFIGAESGHENTYGRDNTFIGVNAGHANTNGDDNIFIGSHAGYENTTGRNNIFIGNYSGYSSETDSNKLYIENSSAENPLIYGDFGDDLVEVNGMLRVIGRKLPFISDLFVDGNSFFSWNLTVGGSIYELSDMGLKDVSGTFTRGLDAIERLQPVLYHYKANNPLHLPSEQEHIGLIAQEVQDVIPEAVEEGKDGYLMVNNDPIIWTMLNAIKELKAENEALREEINVLKETINK